MSDDRELLELAAKAAGYVPSELWYVDGVLCWGGVASRPWNPRTNGDDALRLAAKLYIHITISDHKRTVCRQDGLFRSIEDHGNDAFEATCLAITRAAAEIGKAMQ